MIFLERGKGHGEFKYTLYIYILIEKIKNPSSHKIVLFRLEKRGSKLSLSRLGSRLGLHGSPSKDSLPINTKDSRWGLSSRTSRTGLSSRDSRSGLTSRDSRSGLGSRESHLALNGPRLRRNSISSPNLSFSQLFQGK